MELVDEGVRGGQLEELSTASAPVRGTRIVHKSTGLPPDSVGVFLCRWAFLAQRFTREYEAVMVLHESIKHGVGHRLISYPLMPMLDWQLAGNDGGTLAGAVINDLHQIGPGLSIHGG